MPLAPTVRQKLVTAGFRTAADLEDVRPGDLARGVALLQGMHPWAKRISYCRQALHVEALTRQ